LNSAPPRERADFAGSSVNARNRVCASAEAALLDAENQARRQRGVPDQIIASAAMPDGETQHAVNERRKPINGRCRIPIFQ
jgi:hypothetical protein